MFLKFNKRVFIDFESIECAEVGDEEVMIRFKTGETSTFSMECGAKQLRHFFREVLSQWAFAGSNSTCPVLDLDDLTQRAESTPTDRRRLVE